MSDTFVRKNIAANSIAISNVMTSSQGDELFTPDEFVMKLGLMRNDTLIHDGLVAAGVVEHVRDLGVTQFGEQRRVYRVNF